MQSRDAIGRWLLATIFAALSLQAAAQTLNEVAVVVAGDDVVAHIEFAGAVRLVQQSPITPAKLFQLQFELISAEDAALKQRTTESRHVAKLGAAPEFELVLNAVPNKRIKQLTIQLPEVTQLRARAGTNPRTIDLVFVGKGLPLPAAQASDKRFAIKLASGPNKNIDNLASIPSQFQNFEVFDTRSVADGVTTYEVNLGFFANEADAEVARKSLQSRFPAASVVDISQRREATLKSAAALPEEKPAPAAPVATAAVVAQAATPEPSSAPAQEPNPPEVKPAAAAPEVETQSSDLMTAAREALTKGSTDVAITKLNQLLLLPPNSNTQDAQEMMGLAWERSGDLARARQEYELYLKLFNSGEGAQRVAQRLASMGPVVARATPPAEPAAPEAPKKPELKLSGNLSEFYFGGKTRSQSLVNLDAGIDQSTLTKTTESAIVSNVDLGARYNTDESDIRAVLRGTGSTNLSKSSKNASTLSAAFVDYRQKDSGLAVRLGRQSAINGGLLGMFDGASLTYPVRQGIRVNLMGGVPTNPLMSLPSERLLAGMVEADALAPNLSGDVYIIDQTTEGITNRRAIGTEARYADERGSLYAIVDYDQLFHALNALSVQGSFQGPGQTTYTLLIDSRKAPSLQATNALISSGEVSLKTLLQKQTMDDILIAARATTAQARQVLFSVSRPISEKWQATGDLRYSDIGALPAVANFEATPATGAQYGLSVQLTGSNLYSKRDINNFNVSVLSTPLFHGVQLAYNNLTGFDDNKFTLEPTIRLYTQKDNVGTKMTRVTPGLRASYNVSKRTSVMGEGLLEHSTNQGATSHDTTNSVFFYFGLRYELF